MNHDSHNRIGHYSVNYSHPQPVHNHRAYGDYHIKLVHYFDCYIVMSLVSLHLWHRFDQMVHCHENIRVHHFVLNVNILSAVQHLLCRSMSASNCYYYYCSHYYGYRMDVNCLDRDHSCYYLMMMMMFHSYSMMKLYNCCSHCLVYLQW